MNITECPSCEKELKETASFCSGCGSQVRCTNCKEIISTHDNFCGDCGAKVVRRQERSEVVNTFEFSETAEGKHIKASLTNPAVKDMAETIANFVSTRQIAFEAIGQNPVLQNKAIDLAVEDVAEVVSMANPETPDSLESIFRETGERLELVETRIKASGKGDYTARLTYLIVFYYENKGEKTKKATINSLLEFCGLYDSSFRNWFAKQKADFLIHDGFVELRPAGRQKA